MRRGEDGRLADHLPRRFAEVLPEPVVEEFIAPPLHELPVRKEPVRVDCDAACGAEVEELGVEDLENHDRAAGTRRVLAQESAEQLVGSHGRASKGVLAWCTTRDDTARASVFFFPFRALNVRAISIFNNEVKNPAKIAEKRKPATAGRAWRQCTAALSVWIGEERQINHDWRGRPRPPPLPPARPSHSRQARGFARALPNSQIAASGGGGGGRGLSYYHTHTSMH